MALWKFTNLNKHGNFRTRIVYQPDGQGFRFKPAGLGPFVNVTRFRYKSESPYYGLFTNLEGQKYITPGWIPVVPETTLNDVYYEAPPKPKQRAQKWTFKSSSSDAEYIVKRSPSSGKVYCNCWGYIAHKKCKHVKEVEKKLGS